MHPQLTQLIQMAPILAQSSTRDTAIAITDLNQYVYYQPGELLNHRVKPGDVLREGSLVKEAMRQKKRLTAFMDAKLFGVAYIGIAIPITDEHDTVVGTVFIGENTEKQEVLKGMASDLSDHLGEMSDFTMKISEKTDQLSQTLEMLSQLNTQFGLKLNRIEKFTDSLQNISRKTNMLGINASIESARLGIHGRGFAVVAEEISLLAKQSNASSLNITEMASEILGDNAQMNEALKQVVAYFEQTHAFMQTLIQNIESTYSMVQELTSMSESI